MRGKIKNRALDRRVFKKTANRTRAVNISGHRAQRGGLRF